MEHRLFIECVQADGERKMVADILPARAPIQIGVDPGEGIFVPGPTILPGHLRFHREGRPGEQRWEMRVGQDESTMNVDGNALEPLVTTTDYAVWDEERLLRLGMEAPYTYIIIYADVKRHTQSLLTRAIKRARLRRRCPNNAVA